MNQFALRSERISLPSYFVVFFYVENGKRSLHYMNWPSLISQQFLYSTFSVIGVRLPGRETRRNEQAIGNLDQLIPLIADAIVSQFEDKPFAFFGHR